MGNSTHPGGICPFLYRTLYNKDKCRALYNKTVVQRRKIMKTLWTLFVLTMLFTEHCLFAADEVKGLSDGQFEFALRNISTAPNYILVTVVDGNNGKRQSVCMEAEALLTALHLERQLKWEDAVVFAARQRDRTFTFSNTNALKSVTRAYSEQILQEARAFLAKITEGEIEAGTGDQESEFYKFCARDPGSFTSRFPAVAHVLSERGILCVRSCQPGLFAIDKTTHNKVPEDTARKLADPQH
jgi:hypothetical protein